MDNVSRRQTASGGRHRFARGTATDLPALGPNCRPTSPMYGPINTASAGQVLICGIDDCVCRRCRYVPLTQLEGAPVYRDLHGSAPR